MKPLANIILASASPRRKQLLAEAGYEFEAVPSQIDESAFPAEGICPVEYAKQLALAKAKDVAKKYPDRLVLGADTVVDFDGRTIGKPADAEHAEKIVRMLFSKPHKVVTAVAVVCAGGTGLKSMRARAGSPCHVEIVEADTTVIYPNKLTDSQIAAHISSGAWRNKSGAYAIKEKDDPFVDHIEGSLTNVMGLPMGLLRSLLRALNPKCPK